MTNANAEELRVWVEGHMESLEAPIDWQPDAYRARESFRARAQTHSRWAAWRHGTVWAAAAAMAAAVFVWLAPVGRGVAQQLWQLLTVRQVTWVRVNAWPEGVPSPQVKLLAAPMPPMTARDRDEVKLRVGYAPRLPGPGVFRTSPQYLTVPSLAAGTMVKTADLERALQAAGVTDVPVPREWDGARLALHTSAIALAEWPDAILAQSLPLTLSAPAGFDYAAFTALLLRVMGVGAADASRLAKRMGAEPLAPITPELGRIAAMEEIQLKSGPATLAEQKSAWGAPARITILWSVPDRIYLLTGTLSRDLAIAAANAVE